MEASNFDELAEGFRRIQEIAQSAINKFVGAWGWIIGGDSQHHEYIYRQYATLISHGKPRKVSWRRLNAEQRARAIELARVYGW